MMVMNSKTIFGLMIGILAGLPLQGCCSHTGEGATTSLVVGEERIADASEEIRSEDGLAWTEVDTLHLALVGCYRGPEGLCVDTLTHYEPQMEAYPKQVHSIVASDSSMVYLLRPLFLN